MSKEGIRDYYSIGFNLNSIALEALILFLLLDTAGISIISYASSSLGILPDYILRVAVIRVFLLLLYLTFGLNILIKKISNPFSFIGIILIITVSIIQLIWLPEISLKLSDEEIKNLINILLASGGYLLVGLNIDTIFNLLMRKPLWKYIIFLAYAAFTGIIIWGIIMQQKTTQFLGIYIEEKEKVDYLRISDSFAILTFFILSTINNTYIRNAITILGGVLLFFTLSRASFLFFWLTIIILFLLKNRRRGILPFILLLGVVFAVITIVSNFPLGTLEEYRIIKFVRAPFQDESVQTRIIQFSEGLQRLSEHWLLGSFMAEVTEGRGRGHYMHNWLSFWESYGLIPFILSCIMLGASIIGAIRTLRQKEIPNAQLFSALVGIYCFLSVTIARAYIWSFVWIAFGALGTLWQHEQNFKLKNSNLPLHFRKLKE
jgi:hypothetical protein